MAIDKTLIKGLIDYLKTNISSIENKNFTMESILEDEDIQAILDRKMQLSIETCIDIATHIVAGSNLPRQEHAADIFLTLGKKGIIPGNLAQKLAKATGFRNILVHEYIRIDYELAYSNLDEKLQDLKSFGHEILEFLEKEK